MQFDDRNYAQLVIYTHLGVVTLEMVLLRVANILVLVIELVSWCYLQVH